MSKDIWKPFGRITHIKVDVDPKVVWPADYEPQESYRVPASAGKFYSKASVGERPKRPWTTPEQEKYNRTHKTCPRCHGKGYIRKDANVGCVKCKGRGAIPC